MPETRALPIAAEHREFTIKVGGEAVPREHQLLAVSITSAVNRISSAKLNYVDGAPASGQFPLSDSELFKPGQLVEILAGAGNAPQSLFKGVVVRLGVRVRDSAASQLVIDCRHVVMKLTVGERSGEFVDQSDSEIIEAVLGAASVSAEVEATMVKHQQVLQYHATDWDFLLARACLRYLRRTGNPWKPCIGVRSTTTMRSMPRYRRLVSPASVWTRKH